MGDQRNDLRFPVHWRVAVFPDAAANRYILCETYELSPSGAGIYCDYNLPALSNLLLHLEIPSIIKGQGGGDLEISAQVVHSSLHSQRGFRIGVLFRGFRGDGKAQLTEILTKRFRAG